MTPSAAVVLAPYPAANILRSSTPFRRVSSGPGAKRKAHPHRGADFPGLRGEDVLAFAPGVVRSVRAHRVGAGGRHYYDEVSPGAGREVRASQFRNLVPRFGSGLSVHLVHGPMVAGAPYSLHTMVAHFDSVRVRAGELVDVAQVLGGMGASGVGSGFVHAHLEVFGGPAASDGGDRECLDPRGFQRWIKLGKLAGVQTDRPGPSPRVWPVTWWVVVPCFPRSGTAGGKVGVDVERQLTGAPPYPRLQDGTPVLATGPDVLAAASAPTWALPVPVLPTPEPPEFDDGTVEAWGGGFHPLNWMP